MSIPGIGNTTGNTGTNSSSAAKKNEDAAQLFLEYMAKSPAERMEEAWLKSHGLTKKDLEDMTPEKRQATLRQMAEEIRQQIMEAMKKDNPSGL